jgi:hypothetical protein
MYGQLNLPSMLIFGSPDGNDIALASIGATIIKPCNKNLVFIVVSF